VNATPPLLRLALAALLIPAAGHGQAWRSTLYPENWQRPDESASFYNDKLIQDFSFAGYRRGEEQVPAVTGPLFNVTDYGADPSGASDSTTAIQAAINAAGTAGGGVVLLPAGEFRVSPQGSNTFSLRISRSNIVLRGAGTAQTFLLNTSTNMRGKAVIQVSPTSVTSGAAVPISSGLSGPTRRIPVANAAAFSPGDFVRLEWQFTPEWIAEHLQQTWWSETSRPADARYLREVLAVHPAEGWIEVDAPTRYSMLPRDNPRVTRRSGLLTGVGIESLSIGNLQHPGTTWAENDYSVEGRAAYDVHGSWLIRMQHVRDGWIRRVHSRQAAANTSSGCHLLSNGILLLDSFRITLRDCAMRRAQYGGGGGNGYMYRLQYANECLLDDCIADFSRHGFVLSHAGTSGNVFLECEDRNTARATGATGSYTTSGSGSDNHMHFSHSNLWDRCHAHDSFWTAHHRTTSGTVPHGLTSAHSVYWNSTGSGTRYTTIVRSEQARYGYVIGTSGSRSGATNPTGGNTAPADHLEGIGLGATLEPASLYLDQLSRRLVPQVMLNGTPVRFPENTFTVEASLVLDGQPLAAPPTLDWQLVSAPPGARHLATATSSATGRAFTVSRPGTYTVAAGTAVDGVPVSGEVQIDVSPPAAGSGITDHSPEADSYVRGGTENQLTNYGSAPELLIKDSGALQVHREAFMRFNLSGIPAQEILNATLHLHFNGTDTAATGRTSVVADPDGWGELTIHYANRPTLQNAVVGEWSPPSQDWLVLNAAHVVPSQLSGDGRITFRHQILTQPSQPVYAIASRENPTASRRPFLRITRPVPTLDEWLARNGLEAHERGPLDDPDEDDLANLIEAWLGTDPSRPDAAALSRVGISDDGFQLHLTMNAAPPGGLIYFIESSDTLAPGTWQLTPAVAWEADGPETGGRIPMVARIPADPTATRRFYRVQVELP